MNKLYKLTCLYFKALSFRTILLFTVDLDTMIAVEFELEEIQNEMDKL